MLIKLNKVRIGTEMGFNFSSLEVEDQRELQCGIGGFHIC